MKAILTAALPNLLVRLWRHLSRRRRRQFGMLMGLMLVSAFAEVVSLGAVLPFLGILVAPEHVFNQLYRRGCGAGLGHHLGRSIDIAYHSRVCRGSLDGGSNPHPFIVGQHTARV